MYICLSFFHHIGVSNLHFRILQMITVRYIPAPGFPSCDWLVPSPPPRVSAAVSESVNLKPDPFLAVLALCCAGAPVFRGLLEVLPALMARTVSMTRAVCSLKTKNGSKSTRTQIISLDLHSVISLSHLISHSHFHDEARWPNDYRMERSGYETQPGSCAVFLNFYFTLTHLSTPRYNHGYWRI